MATKSENLVSGTHVTKGYASDQRRVRVLEKADFSFERGTFTAIVGRSGSGKTTLLNLCGGIDRPDKGIVTFEGQHLENLSDKQLAAFRNKFIGFVFQNFFLREGRTALENVMVPLLLSDLSPAQCRLRAQEALEEVGLKDQVRAHVSGLSGGQKQRVAIARAIANHPHLILADEPTGSLDVDTSREILDLLHHYNQERKTTIIVVTHDPMVETFGVPLVTITDGKVVPVENRHLLSTSLV